MNSGIKFNDAAKMYLNNIGIKCVDDTDVIPDKPGEKNPDFLCKDKDGQDLFWLEVKSIDEPENMTHGYRVFDESRKRISDYFEGKNIKGSCVVYYSDNANSHHLKTLIKTIKYAKNNNVIDFSLKNDAIVVIPEDKKDSEYVHFKFVTESGSAADYISVVSESGNYGLPLTIQPNYNQKVTMTFSDGNIREVNLLEVCTFDDDYDISLVMSHSNEDISVSTACPANGAREDDTVDKTRAAIKSANKQLSNALMYRDLPTLTLVFKEYPISMSERNLVVSAYGDLTYSFPQGSFNNGQLIIGKNGVFRKDKNTSTSAVGIIKNDEILLIHNIYAKKGFLKKILNGKECIPESGKPYIFN